MNLSSAPQEVKPIGIAHNRSAMPFAAGSASSTPKVITSQYNNPAGLYSSENIQSFNNTLESKSTNGAHVAQVSNKEVFFPPLLFSSGNLQMAQFFSFMLDNECKVKFPLFISFIRFKFFPKESVERPPPPPQARQIDTDSEVYKMLQENQESNEPPRQSVSFLVLQDILESDEKGKRSDPISSGRSSAEDTADNGYEMNGK
ncbi:hypothetical protein AB205_0050880, partial [Aquarana catesbeiana]